MDTGGLIRAGLLLVFFICVCAVTGSPVGTSTINCAGGGNGHVGVVDEGYSGDVEVVSGITEGVKLVPYVFPTHLEFLELSFTLGDASATVRTKKPLDADALAASDSTLYYSVMCDGLIKYNNTRTLKINDLNDNSPIFTQESYSTSVSETKDVDSEVLRVTAVDGDSTPANNRVTYSIEPTSEDFTLATSGALVLKRRLNYNIVQRYNFIVTAKDSGGLNDTATVLINVVDFDNLNPYFSHNVYQAFIQENEVGSFQTIEPEAIKAQDGDTGINMTVTYSISAVSPDKYQRNFNVDSSSGVVSVLTALDREEMDSSVVSVSIKAAQTDDNLKTADAVVSVTVEDVNDNPPRFDQPGYSVTLQENSPVNAVLFKAVVTDLDQGGFVGTLRILPESAPFSVGSDGTVRVKDPRALDRETTESITFEIEARETNPPNAVEVVEVNVTLLDENDNSPAFTFNKYEGKVFANQTVGMQLVQVKAEDPDAGENGQIKYYIDFGNNDGFFSIEENSGDVTLAKIIPLLQNEISEFPLYITARDGGTISRSSSAQVKILAPGDSNPQFLHNVYRGTLEEEQDAGVVILTVDFLSLAAEVPVTLQVVTEADKFIISDNGDFSTKVKLDYDEAPHNYSVAISISDGVNIDNAVVEVEVTDVNDNSPVFTSSSVTKSVPEDTEVGSNVTAVPATDKDSNFNEEIRYSLRGGEGRFSVDPASGMVSVAGALDRETKAEYNLLVLAEDRGRPSRSATASLLVQVSDINDNVPKFSKAEYQLEVLETQSAGTSLLTLSAVDPDEEANGRITYSILQQSPSPDPPVFELDSSSGTLQLVQPLDYSEVKVYSLTVQASDGGTPSLVGNSSVVVKVKDVNNNPPEFGKENYNVAVSENLASGASILTLEVTDRDEGGFSGGYFLYTSDTFDISDQGLVSVRNNVTLDRETQDSYVLQVVAVDQVTDGLSSTAQLNITVLDYNDNTPQFPTIPDTLQIPEGDYSEVTPGDIFTIVPTDADLGPNGEVTLSLLPPHPLFRFREDGTLLAVGSLDRESRETYELFVKASDKGSPQRENITSIRVSLIDVNDNRPEFSSSSYVSSILLKDAKEGKLLLTLSATDGDAGNNSLITYSYSAGSPRYLALNSETGALTLTSDLTDLTQDTTMVLTARAQDHGQPPLNSTAHVVVNLRLVSLGEGVAFGSSSYNFSVRENQQPGADVGRVSAFSGSDLYDVAYALNTHTDLFSVSASGAVLTRTQLDKEEQEWYILDVEAVDTRTPPTSAITMVRVQVEDVNESPRFLSEVYKASVFSIAPYKTPVVHVKASDPDVGEEGQLVYSLTADSPHFDVDPSSGVVYVVSAVGLAGQTAAVEVNAKDPRGLYATTKLEVEVQGSASSADVVVISLNQPANIVEKKVPELEKSLGAALGWTVNIIEVSSANGGSSSESRAQSAAVKTLVSFITKNRAEVVSSTEVTEKLQSQSASVRAALVKVFGEGLHFDVELKPQSPASSQAAVIALGTMVALCMQGLIVAIALIIRFKRTQKHQDSDKESFDIDRSAEGYRNQSLDIHETFGRGQTRSQEKAAEDDRQRTDRQTDDGGTVKTDGNIVKFKRDSQTEDRDDSSSSL
ncbi:fat-like cadherin-related tumor suppressor homolog [Anarrhichthys ocellatus]|uniref:fat-like cadherin-related tumor suppressor homolog n=1 Tax=Anarrhichthys ocellatus TaxID=433405 RepID=UPI0012EE4FAF|nr:fat-like cadherin-related tumor suppressor homolog [Anarrhichthys ocellatus]